MFLLLKVCFCEYQTQNKSRPTQLAWCGTRSVLVYWEGEDLLMVGSDRDWISYLHEGSIFIVSETDGARIISNSFHELIHRVPGVLSSTMSCYSCGTCNPTPLKIV